MFHVYTDFGCFLIEKGTGFFYKDETAWYKGIVTHISEDNRLVVEWRLVNIVDFTKKPPATVTIKDVGARDIVGLIDMKVLSLYEFADLENVSLW